MARPIIATPFDTLKHNFHNYHDRCVDGDHDRFEALKTRQDPATMMLSCCDSRTDPAMLLGARPGDIFVHRAIASLVPDFDSAASACIRAATWYAVDVLKVRDLVVLGHTGCGGINALVDGPEKLPLADWIGLANPVLERLADPHVERAEKVRFCERATPVWSLANLARYPWVQKGMAESTLKIRAMLYDLATCTLLEYDERTGEYLSVDAPKEQEHA